MFKMSRSNIKSIRVSGILLVRIYHHTSINANQKEESQRPGIMRIITNYLQVITAVLSYNKKCELFSSSQINRKSFC